MSGSWVVVAQIGLREFLEASLCAFAAGGLGTAQLRR